MVNKYLSGLLFGSIYRHFIFWKRLPVLRVFCCYKQGLQLFNTIQT